MLLDMPGNFVKNFGRFHLRMPIPKGNSAA